jgi:ribosomal protein L36
MPEEKDGKIIYKIPEEKFAFFEAKFAKLVKRANKIKVAPPTFKVVGAFKRKIVHPFIDKEYIVPGLEVEVSGKAPIIEGWEFLGAIEHLNEGNMLKGIGKVELTAYRDAKPICQHCETLRRRNQTFVLRNQNNQEFKQVGSNCLVDFLGHESPANIAAMAELIADFYDMCGSAENEFFGGGELQYHPSLEAFLGVVRRVIKEKGWVPRSKSSPETGLHATCDIAWGSMQERERKYRIEPEEGDIEYAQKAILWASEISDDEAIQNEYLHNIRLQAKRGIAEKRFIGYAASILPAYDREMAKVAEKQSAQANSNYVGNPGDKLELELTLTRVKHVPSDFGSTTLSIFKDSAGNQFKWFGTGFEESAFAVGQTKVMWGTVKDHKEYKGVKQTTLTRCTLVMPGWAKKAKKG